MGDMDSGNSGSLQSSSGGDDDYESSRGPAAVDSFSSFFTPPAAHVTLGSFLPNPPPSPPPPPSSYFDPLATYFDHLSRSANPDPVWPKEHLVRPDPNSMPPSTSDHLQPSSSAAGKQGSGGRNPRKRTRASRRAPTTVLTTDTTNFRAMVQEFTGIPSPPFGSSAASPSSLLFPRTRFDLFGNSRRGAGVIDATPYLLRPLAQKLPVPPQPPNKSNSDVMYPDLLFKYPDASPGPSKPGPASGGSLELPITIRPNNNENDQLGGITADFVTASDAVSGSSGKNNGGPLVWAEGLGLGADAGSGGASHQQPHNLRFAHQRIG